jgi:thiamine pyrophosphate-dependent acetolactate synthase large subunit-like protein
MRSAHPLALCLVARNGTYQANHAARQADVLLALGVRFDDRTSSSWLPGYSFTIPPTQFLAVVVLLQGGLQRIRDALVARWEAP